MTFIGFQSLNIALVFSLYASILFFLNGNNPQSKFIKSAQRSIWATFFLLIISSFVLLYALYTRDFQIEYVAHYSNRSLSWFYTFAAFWAGQAGSLLLWALLLSIFSVIVLEQNKNKNQQLLPYTMGVISFTLFFFLYLLVFKSSPFSKLPFAPQDGQGLNPLLQNPEMVFHPPSLYIGFVGFTIPFAFAISALLARRIDEQWIKTIRRWSLFSWLFLTIGNILGMQWAYVELGWGGYWAWDPVENSSLMPWLTGTAFLHSIIAQERKGMLKRWSNSLIALTFALTIFGTFVTRSGLISSVHAFGVSNLGPLFLAFLGIIVVVSFYLIISRSPQLAGKNKIENWSSKESSFLLNSIIFSTITLVVFLGTLWPTLSELITGHKMTVGAESFNRMTSPMGIVIILLIGICAALSWSKTSTNRLVQNLILPIIVTSAFFIIFLLFGMKNILALLSLLVTTFAVTVIVLDYLKGVAVYSKKNNAPFWISLFTIIIKHKRRYGGYIVHIGILAFFLGIIGSSAFSLEKNRTVTPGESIRIGNYDLLYKGLKSSNEVGRNVDAVNFDVIKSGKLIGEIKSEKHLYPNFQPATEVGIRSTIKEDLYLILADYDKSSQTATISILINPLVIWIWIGGIIMVLGTLIALWPDNKKRI